MIRQAILMLQNREVVHHMIWSLEIVYYEPSHYGRWLEKENDMSSPEWQSLDHFYSLE